MKEYQNSLEEMSSEAVEYIRGIQAKTFGQSVFRLSVSVKQSIIMRNGLFPIQRYASSDGRIYNNDQCSFCYSDRSRILAFKGTDDKTFLLNLLFYIIITPIITVTLNKIMYSSENKMLVEDALKRVDGILEREPLEQAKELKTPKDASIVFENVSFRYKDGITDALHGVNLKIEPESM